MDEIAAGDAAADPDNTEADGEATPSEGDDDAGTSPTDPPPSRDTVGG